MKPCNHRGLLASALFLLATACSDQHFIPTDHNNGVGESDEDCTEPPAKLMFDLSFLGESDAWTGECGPEIVSLWYDDNEYTWLLDQNGDLGENAVDCSDGAGTFLRLTDVEALFIDGYVYDWSEYDTISLRGTSTLYDSTTLSEMYSFAFEFDTAFWPSCDYAFVGERLASPTDEDYLVASEADGIYAIALDPSYVPSTNGEGEAEDTGGTDGE